jgi:predicted amidohydrolase
MILRSALIQTSCTYDKVSNVDKVVNLIEEAAADGAQLICLQEFFNTTYFPVEKEARNFDLAERIPGPSTIPLQELARKHGVMIVGSLYEETSSGERFNSAPVIDESGSISGMYRKSSVPDTATDSIRGFEKHYFKPGDTGFRTFDGVGTRIGVLICYDRHYPEAARTLALKGAEVILIPTSTSGMSRDVWEVELRAHALQNQCFVGGVNRVGEESGFQFYGSSVWVGPRGNVIARGGDQGDEIVMANLDLSEIAQAREEWRFLHDRRPELYGRVAELDGDAERNEQPVAPVS